MCNKQLSLIGLALGFICMALVFLLMPTIHYQAHGILLPLNKSPKLTTIPADQVTILSQYPHQYQSIGNISIERHMLNSQLSEIKNVLQKARELASVYGANVVVGQLYTSNPTGPESGMPSYVFRGVAIKAE